jgi:threonine 3-dehydrogenase
MTTLITGGTGFVGSQVTRLLLEKGEKDLVAFDIMPSTKRLEGIVDQVKIVKGDLGNFTHVLNVVKEFRPTVIYHVGAIFGISTEADPSSAIRVNALGTHHVLEAARLFDVHKVLFSSTLGTYGLNIREKFIDDYTLQRPNIIYGATKLFCEHMGLVYRNRYGLDFRTVRFPSLVGPGVKTPGMIQYASAVIEESAKGNPYTIYVKPETRFPVMYFKDAARAIVELGAAPAGNIKMVNYVISGATPVASAQELAEMVKARIPTAQIDFKPNMDIQRILDQVSPPRDDCAQKEWNWRPEFNQERIVEDFLKELKAHPQRYL